MSFYQTRRVGSKFVLKTYLGAYLFKVMPEKSVTVCYGCDIKNLSVACETYKKISIGRGECRGTKRTDRTNVVFKQLKFKPNGTQTK